MGLSDLLVEGIKVVGFDLDGTLYPYTEEIQRRNREEIYGELSRILGIHFEDVDKTWTANQWVGYLFQDSYGRNFEIVKKERMKLIIINPPFKLKKC